MNLRSWRLKEELTLAEMGEMIGKSHSTVLRLESGAIRPDPDTIKAIFDATDGAVTLDDWFDRDGSSKPPSVQAAE
jgi:transcriptional regulator with XRE-family HTH domain